MIIDFVVAAILNLTLRCVNADELIDDDQIWISSTTTTRMTTTRADVKDESNSIWCPTHRIGNQCPEETLLTFYKCCGHLNKECCFHLKVWIVIGIIVLPLCLIIPIATFLLQKLLCATKSSSLAHRGETTSMDRLRQLASEDSLARRDSDEMVML
ncbi:unnamed protein product [Caenorhabditis bovis]|uniref:Uncharacterized protein n=1 Tax=Caenorhabditis bovis TaxID=2654633 RepID=A0A8S1F3U8_9PELO|nr:unnamed protein product [Caenorhabditis bovis]